EEIEHGGARAVVDDCVRSERNRVTGPDRTHVQVDILRRDEPLIEPADLVEHGLAIRQVRRRVGDIRALHDQFDALEFLERAVPDLDRPAGDDARVHEAGSDLLQPERIRDGIAVDKGDDVTLRLPDPEVSAGPAGPSKDVQVDEVVSLLVSPHDVARRLLCAASSRSSGPVRKSSRWPRWSRRSTASNTSTSSCTPGNIMIW